MFVKLKSLPATQPIRLLAETTDRLGDFGRILFDALWAANWPEWFRPDVVVYRASDHGCRMAVAQHERDFLPIAI